MPEAALKPCACPSCPNLVKSGYCPEHQHMARTFIRDPQRQGLYSTAHWKRMRARQLAREPWCVECLEAGVWEPATDVDHIERHEGDPEKFFHTPLQSLCHACHSRKTAGEIFSKGRGGEKVLSRGSNSAGVVPNEKNSQCENFD